MAIFALRFLNFESTILAFRSRAAPGVLFCVLIIPLFDTARVFIMRIVHGQSLFKADRIPIHHHLLDLSGSRLKATSIILVVNIFFIGLAVVFRKLNNELLILLTITLDALLSYIPIYLKYNRKKSKVGGHSNADLSLRNTTH